MKIPFQTEPHSTEAAVSRERTPHMKIRMLLAFVALPLALMSVQVAGASHPRMTATLQVTPYNSSTLALKGSNFTPGTWVNIAVVQVRTGKLIASDKAAVSAKTYQCPLGFGPYCGERNPNAGKMLDELTIKRGSMPLNVRYRDGSINGVVAVLQR